MNQQVTDEADNFTMDTTSSHEGTKTTSKIVTEESECLDETLESYLAGDSNINTVVTEDDASSVAKGTESGEKMEVGDNEGLDESEATESATVQSDEEDEFDELPAGLIRGEPIPTSIGGEPISGKETKKNKKSKKHKGENEALLPPEMDTSPRKVSRLPLAVQSASDTEETDNESMPLLQPPGESHSAAETDDAPVLIRTGMGRRKSQTGKGATLKEGPEEKGKQDFMKKNFNLLTKHEMEEKKKRRSSRVSNAEQQKQADAELENELKASETSTSFTIQNKQSDEQSNDNDQTRQNIFDMFDNSKEDTSPEGDQKKYISKLQAVNTELKSRVKNMEQRLGKSTPSKYREKSQVKMMEAKLARFEKINEDLLLRLQEFEAKESGGALAKTSPGTERKIDTVYRHGKLTFSPAGPSKREALRWDKFEFSDSSESKQNAREQEHKEAKIRALHYELDERTALLRAKEGKLQRLVTEIKERENKADYKEKALQRRVQDIEYRERILEGKTKAAIEKRNKQGGNAAAQDTDEIRSKELLRFEMEQREKELKRRELHVTKREQEAKRKEELLKVTEKQLQELHNELRQEYEQKQDTTTQGSSLKHSTGMAGSSLTKSSTPRSDERTRTRKATKNMSNSAKSASKSRSFTQQSSSASPGGQQLGRERNRKSWSPTKAKLSPWSPAGRAKHSSWLPRNVRPSRLSSGQKQDRGRTRSTPTAHNDDSAHLATTQQSLTSPLIRKDGRGRPRKYPKSNENEGNRKSLKKKDGRGRPRKYPIVDKITVENETPKSSRKLPKQDTNDESSRTPSSQHTPREGRKSRKSTAETPKSSSKSLDTDSKLDNLETETKVSDNTDSANDDEYEFESESDMTSSRANQSGLKSNSLKKPLKSTKKPHGSDTGVSSLLRKRQRSHSASPAPSDGKRHKSD